MKTDLILSESLEDYLEVINDLVKIHGHAHSQEIAFRLNVKKPSVTAALKTLKDKNLINYKSYMPITLTEKGALIADRVSERHKTIKDFFVTVLAVNEDEADKAACKIEHAIGENITARLKDFIKCFENCPDRIYTGRDHFCERGAINSTSKTGRDCKGGKSDS